MSHWAEVDENNTVIRVTVGNDNDENEGYEWLVENLGGTWLKTSYNTRAGIHYDSETGTPSADQSRAFRKNYAAKGYVYDSERDAFIPPLPDHGDWVLDEFGCIWVEVENV